MRLALAGRLGRRLGRGRRRVLQPAVDAGDEARHGIAALAGLAQHVEQGEPAALGERLLEHVERQLVEPLQAHLGRLRQKVAIGGDGALEGALGEERLDGFRVEPGALGGALGRHAGGEAAGQGQPRQAPARAQAGGAVRGHHAGDVTEIGERMKSHSRRFGVLTLLPVEYRAIEILNSNRSTCAGRHGARHGKRGLKAAIA